MSKFRKDKRAHKYSAPEQRARVYKEGMYDGSHSTDDFVLSGHSSGSPNSEMEALSIQVAIDAGRVPDYVPEEDVVPDLKYHGFGATADINGPEHYGDHPSITGDGNEDLEDLKGKSLEALDGTWSLPFNFSIKKTILGTAVVGAAALAYFAYRFLPNKFNWSAGLADA